MFKKSWVGCKFFEVFFPVYFLLSMHTTAFLMQWNFPYFLSHALVTVGCKKCLEFMSNALVILLGSSTYVFGMILGKNAWQSLFVLDLEVWEKPFRGHSTTTWTEFCHFLTPPPPCVDIFLYHERGHKLTFFDPFPPISCSYWMAP